MSQKSWEQNSSSLPSAITLDETESYWTQTNPKKKHVKRHGWCPLQYYKYKQLLLLNTVITTTFAPARYVIYMKHEHASYLEAILIMIWKAIY